MFHGFPHTCGNPFFYPGVAQKVERCSEKAEVAGSNPASGTNFSIVEFVLWVW